MRTLDVVQGTPEWHKERANRFTASEAPVMMGVSTLKSRNKLLKEKHTGIVEENTPMQEKIFANGHKTERMARPIVEAMLGEDLYTKTGVEGDYLASFDGMTMTDEICWEHKQWNVQLAEAVRQNEVPVSHYWQLEQQLMVSGAEKVLFTVSDGTEDNMVHCWYFPEEGRRDSLIAGWEQFAIDLANYTPKTVIVEAKGAAVKSLPAITYKMDGLLLTSNLNAYKEAAQQLVADSETQLESDQDFADREIVCKTFKDAEQKIKTLKEMVLGEVADIDQFTKDLAQIGESIRQARLTSEKQIKTRKEDIRISIVEQGRGELMKHVSTINEQLGYAIPAVGHDFISALKGKKTLTSLQSAADDELARCKIIANASAKLAQANMAILEEVTATYPQLFPDAKTLINESTEHLQATIKARIADEKERVLIAQERAAEIAAKVVEVKQPVLEQAAPNHVTLAPQQAATSQDIVEPNMVTITEAEYEKLINSQQLLAALKTVGVDSWSGYKMAIKLMKSGAQAA